MLVELGPVPSGSVIAWTGFARHVLAGRVGRERLDVRVPDDVAVAFRHYLDEWDAVAGRGRVFRWTADVDAEQVEYLVHAFRRVVDHLAAAAERRGRPLMPDEAQAFNVAIVTALLDALSAGGEPLASYAEDLRRFWPGLS